MSESKIRYEAARSIDTHGFWVKDLETNNILVRYYALQNESEEGYTIYRLTSGAIGWSPPQVMRKRVDKKDLDSTLKETLRESKFYTPNKETGLIENLQERFDPVTK
jgi:hypothetical protein